MGGRYLRFSVFKILTRHWHCQDCMNFSENQKTSKTGTTWAPRAQTLSIRTRRGKSDMAHLSRPFSPKSIFLNFWKTPKFWIFPNFGIVPNFGNFPNLGKIHFWGNGLERCGISDFPPSGSYWQSLGSGSSIWTCFWRFFGSARVSVLSLRTLLAFLRPQGLRS